MRINVFVISIFVLFLGCKKTEDRPCYKSFGDVVEKEIALDSVNKFELYKNIKYRFYQDSTKKIVVRGGKNMVNFVDIRTLDYVTSINNLNKCNFLRNSDNLMEVDIHYPTYNSIYAEPTDSIIFMDTLKGDFTKIELRNGGGFLDLTVDMNHISLSVSFGVGSYVVKGRTKYSNLSIQNMGRGNALGLTSDFISIYQNSNNDLYANFDSAEVKILYYANGDVFYSGTPDSLSISGIGDGEVLPY